RRTDAGPGPRRADRAGRPRPRVVPAGLRPAAAGRPEHPAHHARGQPIVAAGAAGDVAAGEPDLSGSWSPTLSPDGRRSAYVSDRGGMPQVWVEPGSVVPTGSSPVIAVRWSPCGD